MNILQEADDLTSVDRQQDYGHPGENHGITAQLFDAYIQAALRQRGKITRRDVCFLNILQKISRAVHNPYKRDTWVDIAGYARNIEMIHEWEEVEGELLPTTEEPINSVQETKGFTYLACPYTDESLIVRLERTRIVSEFAAALMRRGEVVYSPITHGTSIAMHGSLDESHDWWMNQCLPFVRRASKIIILQLPGWHSSKGIAIEKAEAERHGIPIQFIAYITAAETMETTPHSATVHRKPVDTDPKGSGGQNSRDRWRVRPNNDGFLSRTNDLANGSVPGGLEDPYYGEGPAR